MPLLQRSSQIDSSRVAPGRRYRIGVAAYRKRGSSGLVERVVHANPGSGGAAEDVEFGPSRRARNRMLAKPQPGCGVCSAAGSGSSRASSATSIVRAAVGAGKMDVNPPRGGVLEHVGQRPLHDAQQLQRFARRHRNRPGHRVVLDGLNRALGTPEWLAADRRYGAD